LIESGLQEEFIRNCATTGIIADIVGQGPEIGTSKCIAFRADTDALNMNEDNPDLPY
jgi:metal-dependent amidase/aminoacylase/carboxypeptidase family protein